MKGNGCSVNIVGVSSIIVMAYHTSFVEKRKKVNDNEYNKKNYSKKFNLPSYL